MGEKKYKWHKVADTEADIDWQDCGIGIIEFKEKKICVTKFKDEWFGFASTCPHAGGLMSEGYVDEIGNIVCPVHRYKFSLQNGRNTSGEGYHLKTYPMEQREAGIFIGIAEGGLFGWL
jgi:nitrite reductase/ring-hydroxylating ferredoxin subunit